MAERSISALHRNKTGKVSDRIRKALSADHAKLGDRVIVGSSAAVQTWS